MKVWVRTEDVSATGGFGAWIAGTPTGRTRKQGGEEQREILLPSSKTGFFWPGSEFRGEIPTTDPRFWGSDSNHLNTYLAIGECSGVVYLSRSACPLCIRVALADLPADLPKRELRWSCQAPTQLLPSFVTP